MTVVTQRIVRPDSTGVNWLHTAEADLNEKLRPFGLSIVGSPTLVSVTMVGDLVLRWQITSDWS